MLTSAAKLDCFHSLVVGKKKKKLTSVPVLYNLVLSYLAFKLLFLHIGFLQTRQEQNSKLYFGKHPVQDFMGTHALSLSAQQLPSLLVCTHNRFFLLNSVATQP